MIAAPLAGLALLAATMASAGLDGGMAPPANTLTTQQKRTAVQPLVRSATECIARSVAADPRYAAQSAAGDLRELIVDSMSSCNTPVRVMIDTYDRYFGDGAGEEFFMGAYLEILPTAVNKWVRDLGVE